MMRWPWRKREAVDPPQRDDRMEAQRVLWIHSHRAQDALRKAEDAFAAIALSEAVGESERGRAVVRSTVIGDLSMHLSYDIGRMRGGGGGSPAAIEADRLRRDREANMRYELERAGYVVAKPKDAER